MTDAQRVQLKTALETKRRELVGDIRKQAPELAIGDGAPDPIDRVQSMSQRDEAVGHVRRLSRTLSDVESSLRAMSEGCYGDCAKCGEPIAMKRLESIPWAACCVRCQAEAEQPEPVFEVEPVAPSDEDREAA